MKSAKLMPLPSKAKSLWTSFLLAIFLSILLYYFLAFTGQGANAPAIVSIAFFFIWTALAVVFVRHTEHITIKKPNVLADISLVSEIRHTKEEKEIGTEIVRTNIFPAELSLQGFLSDKGANRNIAISGMARSGKTYLLYWLLQELKEFKTERGKVIPLNRIVLQAKSSDRFKELGIPTLFIKHYCPNVFADPDAFIGSWKVAFGLTMRGITAVRIEPLLLDIVKSIQANPSWEAFKGRLDELLAKEKGISGEALATIQSVVRSIAIEDNSDNYRKMANMELPKEVVIDFEDTNVLAFGFYGEYLLRQLDKEIESGKREGTSIMIGEAHLFNKDESIIPRISAVISSRGSLIVATQQISTIAGQIKGNCGTQFCFKQTERDDLNEASALSPVYHWIVQRLYPYEAVDLAQNGSHLGIRIMKLFNPAINWQPVKEWIPQGKERTQRQGGAEEQEHKIDYQRAVIEVLNTAGNIQEIGKRIADKYEGKAERHRLNIKNLLPKMVLADKIGMQAVDYVKFSNDKVFISTGTKVYYRRGASPSGLHNYLVIGTANVVFKKGQIPKIMPEGIGSADIETEKYVYEVETGLKNATQDVTERIAKYKTSGKETIIIVPNNEVKAKYVKQYPKVKVYTIPELWSVVL